MRVGCYVRVSTEEQAIKGFSIETQTDNLTEYCQRNGLKIVDVYADEGISGAKPPMKRPALQRLLDDVAAGRIDLILFTKLDRWFRSVPEYFKVQEILDAHRVEWKAIHEDYDTTTANGRMAITIFLAIAQNEREKTAERIKVVFDHKRKNKEACFGGGRAPMGYRKERDAGGILRLVKDPDTEQMTNDFWEIMVKYNNISKAIRHMNDVYGVTRNTKSWSRIVKNEFYCGRYDGVDGYCEPYVSVEDWTEIQNTVRAKTRKTKSNRVYLFAGMIHCPHCGCVLCGHSTKKTYNGVVYEYNSYRCRFLFTTCEYKRTLSERKIEKHLIENLKQYIGEELAKVDVERRQQKPKPRYSIAALKERQRRLNVSYFAGNMTDDEYLTESKEIKELIVSAESAVPKPERDTSTLQRFLETDFESIYAELSKADKRCFWQQIIKEIKVTDKEVTSIIFR